MEREPRMEIDNMKVEVSFRQEPLKVTEGVTMTPDQIKNQLTAVKGALREVNPETPGTCIDERSRIGTLNGEESVEPRHSAPGGPNIYALYIAELIGYFGDDDTSGKERLEQITGMINEAGISSGGHQGCAANNGFEAILGLIGGQNSDQGRAYAMEQLGDNFDEQAYEQIIESAKKVVESGRYADWSEAVLIEEVLGGKDGEAGTAIEVLDGQHEGRTFARVKAGSQTVDQTELHNAVGEDTFVNDEDYEDRIDMILADGPKAVWKAKLALHAREALLAALYPALPNKELHQINISV
jgi:hypothetical protein